MGGAIALVLKFVPAWAWALLIAALAAFAGYSYIGWQREIAAHARDNGAAEKRQADALAAEIKRSNETIDLLRANHAKAVERAAKAESEAAAASSAADSAGRMARRVRDASETSLLAARTKIEAAGATKQCAPAIEAANLRELMFRRIDAVADEIGSAAVGISRHADQAFNAATECAAAYKTVTR